MDFSLRLLFPLIAELKEHTQSAFFSPAAIDVDVVIVVVVVVVLTVVCFFVVAVVCCYHCPPETLETQLHDHTILLLLKKEDL